ncbi:hypothetical protein AAG570_001296 [Ranatra chinensis]|uniref:WH1 domain-containing protein n=1 Tax=Ranatra chinensis TaxID=642074 RepID=A0ABD0YQ96_9HEMI
MTRDDSTGGWVPMGGGGLSNVSVRKRLVAPDPDDTKHEYLIFGKRISDQTVVLSCVIKKDFEYNKVMPTFHHWKTGDKKFGLTFQTAADARAFDKGVRTAVEELLDGLAASLLRCKNNNADVGDDDVFMTLNLPVERGDSRSSSDSSTGRHMTPPQPPAPPPPPPPHEQDSYSYVQLTSVHEYMYPVVEEGKGGTGARRDSGGSLKKRSPAAQPCGKPGSGGGGGRRKERCRHCQEPFCQENNVRGSCAYAPDCTKESINAVACVSCARCVLYQCVGGGGGGEGGSPPHPCDCTPVDDNCSRRWVGLALLSLLLPCLWCYPPLRACHWCCVSCGLCGGKHTPAS